MRELQELPEERVHWYECIGILGVQTKVIEEDKNDTYVWVLFLKVFRAIPTSIAISR